MVAAVAIFALTYLVVAAGRLPPLSSAAVNGDTLGLLLGTMILSSYLGEAGFFRWASFRVLRAVAGPRTLLWALVFTAGVLSAFLVNDTVGLMMAPLVLRLVEDAKLPARPYLLALAFGSNAGSVATLTGNPQNMIVGTLSGISYARFAAALALPAIASLAVVAGLLHALFRRDLPKGRLAAVTAATPEVDRRLLRKALGATALALAGFALAVGLALLLAERALGLV
ncbi:MAG TPA: SLC13 family permease [Anaeromyxobacter sp.]